MEVVPQGARAPSASRDDGTKMPTQRLGDKSTFFLSLRRPEVCLLLLMLLPTGPSMQAGQTPGHGAPGQMLLFLTKHGHNFSLFLDLGLAYD